MDISALLIKMVIFASLIIIGYLFARKGLIEKSFAKSASTLLINVFIVASVVNSVLGERPKLPKGEFAKVMAALIVVYILIFVCGRLASEIFFRGGKDKPQNEILLSVVNNLFIGMPVAAAVCGSEAIFYVGMSNVPFNIFLYSYGVWRLKQGGGKVLIRDMITVPLIAALTALLIFVINPPIPRIISEFFSTVSAGTIPLSMIVIGATMGPINLADAFREKKAYIIGVLRLVIVPLLVYAVCRGMNCGEVLTLSCTVMAGCPSAVICTPLSIQYGYDPTYSSEIVMVTTALSVVTLPILIVLLF